MPNKVSGISKLYIAIVSLFVKDYTEEAYLIGKVIKAAKRDVRRQLDEQAAKRLEPIVSKLFTDGIKESNTLVKKDVAKLGDLLSMPFKYNKDIIETFNKESVFQGFYDKKYKDLYTKREIDALKRTILRGKYANWSDKQLAAEIRKTINTSKNRALVTARNETARLETAVVDHFYQQKKVQDKYDKVWVTKGDSNVRPEHQAANGQIADKDGYFTVGGEKVKGPPQGFSCRCRAELVLKKEEK